MRRALWLVLLGSALGQINNGGGSGGAPAASKYIVQGTADAGLANAQFLGSLTSGIPWLTTTTGVLATASPTPFTDAGRTTSIVATTLCGTTSCPAGLYLISLYLSETGTGCTSVGSGVVTPTLSFIDVAGQTRTSASINGSNGTNGTTQKQMTLTVGGTAFFQANYVVDTNGAAVGGSDAIQIAATVTACTTPGPWSGYRTDVVTTRIK